MARKPGVEYKGAVYHVTHRGTIESLYLKMPRIKGTC